MASFAFPYAPASFDDPVFVRTHFLEKVAGEDLGLHQQHDRLKRRSSRHDDLSRWGARWFTINHHADVDLSDESDDASDGEDQLKNQYRHASHRLERASSTSTVPTITIRQEAFIKQTRHDRSASAPQPRLLPAQPLSINTSQPLRLASPNVSTLSLLSYPVSIFTAAQAKPQPVKQKTVRAASSRSASTAAPVSRRTIECSESDGSCHGDAGDQDPEAQLAAEIIRLRNARKAEARNEPLVRVKLANNSLQQGKQDEVVKVSTMDYSPDADFDSDEDQSLVIKDHAGGFVIRFAEAILDFGPSSLEHLTGKDTTSLIESNASRDPIAPVRRASTTPQDLGREARDMLQKRQESLSAGSSRNNSENSLNGWFFNGASSRPSSRRHASLLSLPSLLSSSGPLWSPSSSALPSLSASPNANLEDLREAGTDVTDDDDDGPHGFGAHGRQYSGYGLTSYMDEPSAFADPSATGMHMLPSTHVRVMSRQRATSSSHKRMTNGALLPKRQEHVSPLWSEQDAMTEKDWDSPWPNLFGF